MNRYFIKTGKGHSHYDIKEIDEGHYKDIVSEKINPLELYCVVKTETHNNFSRYNYQEEKYESYTSINLYLQHNSKGHTYKTSPIILLEVCDILGIPNTYKDRSIPTNGTTIGIKGSPLFNILDKYGIY